MLLRCGCVLLAVGAATLLGVVCATPLPNIVVFLADDLGHYNVEFTGNTNATTPTINSLAREGLILNRHYVYKYCSPTRSSFLSGRLPIHVNTANYPTTKFGGVDIRMATVAEKMQQAGYATVASGKWHGGGHLEGQLPIHRGFDTSIGYLNGEEDHYTHYFGLVKGTDMWEDDAPRRGLDGVYGGDIYVNKTVSFIKAASPDKPLFIYSPFQNTHAPLEVPDSYLSPDITGKNRKAYYGMAHFLDDSIANITRALQEAGRWNNTLVIFSADNGGPAGSGTNYPLRGFKYSDFEGGVRAAAFVSGPYLPEAMRGRTTDEPMHICDWFSTLSSLVGVDPTDNTTAVPRPDSLDMGNMLFRGGKSPRVEVPLSVDAVINGTFKYMAQGAVVKDVQVYDVDPVELKQALSSSGDWSGTTYPTDPAAPSTPCSASGCLFDLSKDIREEHDLSGDASLAPVLKKLMDRLDVLRNTSYQTGADKYLGEFTSCITPAAALQKYKGYAGPLCTKP